MGLLGFLAGAAINVVAKSVAEDVAIDAGAAVADKLLDDDESLSHHSEILPNESRTGCDDIDGDGGGLPIGVVAAPVYIIRDAINRKDPEEYADNGVPTMVESEVGHMGDDLPDHVNNTQVQHLPPYNIKK